MKIRFCSLCLATEVRVFEFMNSEAKRFIENTFTEHGFHQSSYEKQYICYECNALLKKTYQFIKKTLTAQQTICNLYKDVNKINLQQLKTISRTKLSLDTNLTTHELYNIECYVPRDKKDFANENDCEPDVKAEHQDDEFEIEFNNFNFADPFYNLQIKNESETIKAECGAISDNSLSDLHNSEEILVVGPKSPDTKDIEILTCDESSLKVNSANNNVMSDNNTFKRAGNNKSYKEEDTNYTISPKLLRKSKKENDDVKPDEDNASETAADKKKDSDPDFSKNLNKIKNKKKYVRKRTQFKPSAFMLSLPSYAEKKRPRNIKKYAYSVYNEDINDPEYKPKSSSDSFDENEEFKYVTERGGTRTTSPDLREYPMKCDHCEVEIPQKKVHYHHYLMYHPKTEYPYASNKPLHLLCQFCGHASSTTYRHECHILTHSSERTYFCHKCPKSFKNQIRLRRHIGSVHSDKYLECNYCGKKVKTRVEIVRHLRIHTGEKPFKCHICDARFAHKGNVGIHVRSKHQGQPQKYTKKKNENGLKIICSTIEEQHEPLVFNKKRKTPKAKTEKAKKKIKPSKW